jgi:hypothetical protein
MPEKLVCISQSFRRWTIVAYTDPYELVIGNASVLARLNRDKATTFKLRLGSASPPGKADKRFRYVQPNIVRYFVIRLGLATYVE